MKKPPTSYTPTQQTKAFKSRMQQDNLLVAALEEKRSRKEVAKIMGVSTEMIRRIECGALDKVARELRKFYAEGL